MENSLNETYLPVCGCVGYAYVPVQEMGETYCPPDALFAGTVFPELNMSICEYGKVCKKAGGLSDE